RSLLSLFLDPTPSPPLSPLSLHDALPICQPPHAAYPQLRRPGPGLAAYLALLRLGVTVPRLLPGARWALTPPFHPYPWIKGGLFSVALSVASRRPGVTWQSALGSSDFPQHTTRTGMPRPSRP